MLMKERGSVSGSCPQHKHIARSKVFLTLTKSLIHFEFILVCGVRRWCGFIFAHLSNFPNTNHWIGYLYPTVGFCLFCQILIDHKGVGLFLGSLFCSTDLYVYFYRSTVLFWLLRPCSIVWYQVTWFLQFCSFLRLLWLFRVLCGFIKIFGIFVFWIRIHANPH